LEHGRICTDPAKMLEHSSHVLQGSRRVLVLQGLGSTAEPDIYELRDWLGILIIGHARS
jgi:hypothetical protein